MVALRSKALGVIAGRGGMMSVALPAAELDLDDRLSIAAINGPSSVVVSGDVDALAELRERLDGVRTRVIPVDYASHSHHVEVIHDDLLTLLAGVSPRVSEVPFFSTVTGDWLDTTTMDAGYWYRNLRGTVLLEDAVKGLARQGYGAFVEVSPHPGLTAGIQETAENAAVVGTLRRGEGGLGRFLLSVAEAHVQGVPVDWPAVFSGTGPPASPSRPTRSSAAASGRRSRRRPPRRARPTPPSGRSSAARTSTSWPPRWASTTARRWPRCCPPCRPGTAPARSRASSTAGATRSTGSRSRCRPRPSPAPGWSSSPRAATTGGSPRRSAARSSRSATPTARRGRTCSPRPTASSPCSARWPARSPWSRRSATPASARASGASPTARSRSTA